MKNWVVWNQTRNKFWKEKQSSAIEITPEAHWTNKHYATKYKLEDIPKFINNSEDDTILVVILLS